MAAASETPPHVPSDDELTVIVPPAAVDAALDPAATRVQAGGVMAASAGTLPGERPRTMGTLPGGALAVDAIGSALRQVGRYQIGERLGRGGMATVYKAHDPGIGRDVAIKFLHASLCEDEEYRARFLREARAAGGLSHPNICTVYDVGEIEGRPYMAMELIDGDVLSEAMDQGKAGARASAPASSSSSSSSSSSAGNGAGQALAVRDVVVMGIQLARALDYAHTRGIVHRDIKPGNVMRVKGTQTVKVLDFGIAHMESAGHEQRTRVGDILGTPQYMSPEQAQGEKLDGRSDLFSAGILLYQMLTGQRPFLGDSLVALAMKIANDDPPPIEKLRPDVPASLRRVVSRCLAKPIDRRFQTGKELSDALTRVLAELDEAAKTASAQRIVPLRVKWAGLMALVVAVVMGVTGAVVTHRQDAALTQQILGTGAALARFIAAQNATAALGEDWAAVDVAVQEVMKTRDFASVDVMDRAGVVRASSTPEHVGQPFVQPAGERLGVSGGADAATAGTASADGSKPAKGAVQLSRYAAPEGMVLGFAAPITFQTKTVGAVALGIAEAPLTQVARVSMLLMAVLVLVTVVAVAVAMYVIANWFAKPIELVADSMGEIAKGRVDHRIREHRNDEFGLLYAAFDRMAQALQDRQAGAGQLAGGPHTPTVVRHAQAELREGAGATSPPAHASAPAAASGAMGDATVVAAGNAGLAQPRA